MKTEKRLIDANYLVNKGIRNCPIEDGGIPLGDFAQHQKILELYPTVDAVEVVHGRWIEAEDGDGAVCSVCGEDFCHVYLEVERFLYCPNCGSKMDGDTE